MVIGCYFRIMKKSSFILALLTSFILLQACSDVNTSANTAPVKTVTSEIGSILETPPTKTAMVDIANDPESAPMEEAMAKVANVPNLAAAKDAKEKVSDASALEPAKPKLKDKIAKASMKAPMKEDMADDIKTSSTAAGDVVKAKIEKNSASIPTKETTVDATKSTPSARTNKAPEMAAGAPSHAAFSGLLKKYVSGGKVNYSGFKSDQATLKEYINMLGSNAPEDSWKRTEKLAYWINAYNAATINLLLDNYPVSSIKDINNGKPWDMKVVKLGDKTYTLNEIENGIIRPSFNEPRIHFAVNCGAISCPPIRNEAFVASKLNAQLDEQAKDFINDEKYNSLNGSTFRASEIFNWYGKDFGDVKAFIANYTTLPSDVTLEFANYDWSLNKQ